KPSSQSLQALRYYSEGVQFLQQGKNSDAVRSFEAATREDSSFALAYSKLAQAYFNLGMTREAEEDSRRAVDLSARLPQQERLLIAANHAQIINDNAKTIEAYESLVSIVPDEPEFHFALGRIYEATGNAQKALEHYRRVLNRDSKNVNALLAVGRAEIRRGNAQAAMEPLNSALSLAIHLEKEGAKVDMVQ